MDKLQSLLWTLQSIVEHTGTVIGLFKGPSEQKKINTLFKKTFSSVALCFCVNSLADILHQISRMSILSIFFASNVGQQSFSARKSSSICHLRENTSLGT